MTAFTTTFRTASLSDSLRSFSAHTIDSLPVLSVGLILLAALTTAF